MKKTFSNIKIKMTILIALVIVTISAISFGAFFTTRVQTNDNQILSGCFSTSFTGESASISLTKAIPLNDEEGNASTPYTFTITNTCNLNADYYVILSSTTESFSNNYINYKFNSDEPATLGSAQTNTLGTDSGYSDSRIIGSGVLKVGASKTIDIRLWLNDNADYSQIHGSTWSGQIKIINRVSNDQSQLLADAIISTYGTDTNLYYHTTDTSKYRNGEGSITSTHGSIETTTYISLNAGDNSYRYAGPSGTYFYVPAQYNGGTNGQLYTKRGLADNASSLIPILMGNGANIEPVSQTEVSIDGTTYNMRTQPEQTLQALIVGGYIAMTNVTMNNYVCFGTSNESTCLNDTSNNGTSKYLYRIIGVFDDGSGNYVTKLIMANPLYNSTETMADIVFDWDFNVNNNHANEWRSAALKQWLNGETLKSGSENDYPETPFLSNYTSTWTNKILPYTWYVRGIEYSNNGFNAKSAYTQEIYNVKNSVSGYTTTNQGTSPVLSNTKVGLMYVSDYMYAASPTYWNYPEYLEDAPRYDYRAAAASNWLVPENWYWTISPNAEDSGNALGVFNAGDLYSNVVTYSSAVLPVVYLSSDIVLDASATSADGSPSHPYILVAN